MTTTIAVNGMLSCTSGTWSGTHKCLVIGGVAGVAISDSAYSNFEMAPQEAKISKLRLVTNCGYWQQRQGGLNTIWQFSWEGYTSVSAAKTPKSQLSSVTAFGRYIHVKVQRIVHNSAAG
jgi:hypothetical protein